MKQFNSLVTEITVEFECIQCETKVEETFVELPIVNMEADSVSGSENATEESIVCPECGKEYTCNIYVNMNEGNIEIVDDEGNDIDIVSLDEMFEEE